MGINYREDALFACCSDARRARRRSCAHRRYSYTLDDSRTGFIALPRWSWKVESLGVLGRGLFFGFFHRALVLRKGYPLSRGLPGEFFYICPPYLTPYRVLSFGQIVGPKRWAQIYDSGKAATDKRMLRVLTHSDRIGRELRARGAVQFRWANSKRLEPSSRGSPGFYSSSMRQPDFAYWSRHLVYGALKLFENRPAGSESGTELFSREWLVPRAGRRGGRVLVDRWADFAA